MTALCSDALIWRSECSVSICTFVPVKQVNRVQTWWNTRCWSSQTLAASEDGHVRREKSSVTCGLAEQRFSSQGRGLVGRRLLRARTCACASKSRERYQAFVEVVVEQLQEHQPPLQKEVLRCQYLYFCTSKASKLM
jgi:hypothetical protein